MQILQWSPNRPGECAVIAPSDWDAFLLIRALRERGVTPGRDVGLISFDDHPLAAQEGITSVRPPIEDLGQMAGRLLLHGLLEGLLPVQTRLVGSVIPRVSTQRRSGERKCIGGH